MDKHSAYFHEDVRLQAVTGLKRELKSIDYLILAKAYLIYGLELIMIVALQLVILILVSKLMILYLLELQIYWLQRMLSSRLIM